MNISEFAAARGISAAVVAADNNPNLPQPADAWAANHWRVTLKLGRRQMLTYFSTGSAITETPDAALVLESLASDAASIEWVVDFEQWADELGLDPDSRAACRSFDVIRRQSKRLKAFLGDEAYDELLETAQDL